MRTVLLLWVVLAGAQSYAANTVFGTTDAVDCYRSASADPPIDAADACTAAIETGQLTKRELAATYSNRGIILAKGGQLTKAIEDQNNAIKLDPESARAHVNRANLYYRSNRHAEALADYGQAISLSEGALAPAYYNRAMVHKALGENDAARDDLQQAAKLAPQSGAYKAALDRLHRR